MIISGIKELYHTMIEYYFLRNDYSIENDPTFTYQELCLFENIRIKKNSSDEIDTDDMFDCLDDWEKFYVAHFTCPPVIDKPWDQVLQDRRNRPANLFKNEDGTNNIWYEESPYREMSEEERKRVEELFRLDEIRREKNRIRQRERRAKLKEDKEKRNGR